jgi:hypothetical protein
MLTTGGYLPRVLGQEGADMARKAACREEDLIYG